MEKNVWIAIHRIITVDPAIIYFCDRDGQCFLHYIAKDGFKLIFSHLITAYYYNSLIRDRSGRTPWDLLQNNVDDEQSPDNNLIYEYLRDVSKQSDYRFTLNHLDFRNQPASEIYLRPTQFFTCEKVPQKDKGIKGVGNPEEHHAQGILRDMHLTKEPIWIHLDVTDVSL